MKSRCLISTLSFFGVACKLTSSVDENQNEQKTCQLRGHKETRRDNATKSEKAIHGHHHAKENQEVGEEATSIQVETHHEIRAHLK